MDMISELSYAKSNVFKLDQNELREWVDQFKPKDDDNNPKSDSHLLYLIAKLKVYDIDTTDDGLMKIEDWFITVLNENYESVDKESIAFRLRLEFIEELHFYFATNKHFTRSCELIKIIEYLNEIYAEDHNIAAVYSKMLLDQPIEICMLRCLEITNILNKVDELIIRHNFNENIKNEIQFK